MSHRLPACVRVQGSGHRLDLHSPDCLPSDDGPYRATFQFPAIKGSVARARKRVLFPEGPFKIRVDKGNVRLCSNPERSFWQTDEFGWIHSVHRNQTFEIDRLGSMNEDGEKEPELGFQTQDAEGSAVKLHLLFKESVGGMVAAEDGDGAVGHSFDERFDILAVPKRRIHFVISVKGTDQFVRESNMVRAKFAGYWDPAGSGISQQTDAAARTEMLAVDPGIAEIGQENISGHDNFLRGSRPAGQTEHRAPVPLVHDTAAYHVVILTMVHDGQIEHPGVFHCALHHFMVLHAVAIVGDGHDSRLCHRSDRSHLLTVQALGDSASWEHVDQSVFPGPIDDPGDGACAIRRRVRVGHADDGSKSTGSSGLASGLDGFLVGLTGLPQMNVDIDQSGSHHQVPRIDSFPFAGRRLSRNVAIHHIKIGNLIPVGRGVDDPAFLNYQVRHRTFLAAVLHK